jgi:Holliday junction DNA helicase RuvA
MIGKITGLLEYTASDHALISCGGVGYVVYVGPKVLTRLPQRGERVALYTEMVVREDLLQLVGFTTLLEKEWHRLLVSVQGVGVKASVAILDTLGAEGIGRAITLGDAAAVKAAPGVGPKLAQRIVNELKSKTPDVMAFGAEAARAAAPSTAVADDTVLEPPPLDEPFSRAEAGSIAESDAVSALVHLGVGHAEAIAAAAAAAQELGSTDDTAALIKAGLKRLGSAIQ